MPLRINGVYYRQYVYASYLVSHASISSDHDEWHWLMLPASLCDIFEYKKDSGVRLRLRKVDFVCRESSRDSCDTANCKLAEFVGIRSTLSRQNIFLTPRNYFSVYLYLNCNAHVAFHEYYIWRRWRTAENILRLI